MGSLWIRLALETKSGLGFCVSQQRQMCMSSRNLIVSPCAAHCVENHRESRGNSMIHCMGIELPIPYLLFRSLCGLTVDQTGVGDKIRPWVLFQIRGDPELVLIASDCESLCSALC